MRYPILALVLLMLPWPTPATAQADATTDPGVDEIQLSHEPRWIEGSAVDASVRAWIRNEEGTLGPGVQVYFEWREGNTITTLNQRAESSRDVTRLTLEPGQRTLIEAPWRLQPQQTGDGFLRVRIVPLTPDSDPSDNVLETPVFIQVRDLQQSATPLPATLGPDEIAWSRLQLANQGNQAERLSIGFGVVGAPPRQALDLHVEHEEVELLPGDSVSILGYVRYPYGGDDSAANPTLAFSVQNEFELAPRVVSAGAINLQSRRDVGAMPFSVTGLPARLAVHAEGEAVLTVRITNLGARLDSYRLGATATGGWQALLNVPSVFGEPRTAAGHNEAADVQLRIRAPATAAQAAEETLHLTIVSDHGTQAQRSVPLVLHGSLPRLAADPPTGLPFVDSPLNVSLRLRNDGNEAIDASRLTAWFGDANPVELASVAPLPPGGSRTFVAGIVSPSDPGHHVLQVEWTETATGRVLGHAAHDVHNRRPHVLLTPPTPQAGAPGQVVSYGAKPYAFVIRNLGAHPEHVQYVIQATRGTIDSPLRGGVRILGGAEASIPFLHRLPSPAGFLLQDPVRIDIEVPGFPPAASNASVQTLIQDQSPPTVDWRDPVAKVSVGSQLHIEAATDDDTAIQQVRLTVARNAVNTTHAMTHVEAGIWQAGLRLDTPGSYQLMLEAIDRVQKATNRTYLVDVLPHPSPRIVLETPLDNGRLKGNVLHGRVFDNASIQLAVRRVSPADANDTFRPATLPLETGRFEFLIQGLGPGEHRLRLTATNQHQLQTHLEVTVLVPVPAEVEAPANSTSPSTEATLAEAPTGGTAPALPGFAVAAALGLALWHQRLVSTRPATRHGIVTTTRDKKANNPPRRPLNPRKR